MDLVLKAFMKHTLVVLALSSATSKSWRNLVIKPLRPCSMNELQLCFRNCAKHFSEVLRNYHLFWLFFSQADLIYFCSTKSAFVVSITRLAFNNYDWNTWFFSLKARKHVISLSGRTENKYWRKDKGFFKSLVCLWLFSCCDAMQFRNKLRWIRSKYFWKPHPGFHSVILYCSSLLTIIKAVKDL